MSAIRYINKILRINTLVKLRATGNPRELADKLGISERSVYEYISNMKELGAPIAYSYSHNSYIYYEEGDLVIGFSYEMINNEESESISGGGRNLSLPIFVGNGADPGKIIIVLKDLT
jgi:predicted DNA-binding transcriptional regulator YafY